MESPGANPPRGTLAAISVVALAVDVLLAGLSCYAMLVVRPRFLAIFRDFNTELPALTEWLLRVPSLVFLLVVTALVASLILKEAVSRNWPVNLSLNLAAGLGLLAFDAILLIAFFGPLQELLGKLGG
jgi:hypothetical protein